MFRLGFSKRKRKNISDSSDESRRTTNTSEATTVSIRPDEDYDAIQQDDDGDDDDSGLYVSTPSGWSESMENRRVSLTTGFHFPSLPHNIYSSPTKKTPKSRKASQLVTWDENQEEIYSRVVNKTIKQSRGASLAGGVGKMLSKVKRKVQVLMFI